MKLRLKAGAGAGAVRYSKAGLTLVFQQGETVDLIDAVVRPALENARNAAGGDLANADLRGVQSLLGRLPALRLELLKRLPSVEALDEPAMVGLEDLLMAEDFEARALVGPPAPPADEEDEEGRFDA